MGSYCNAMNAYKIEDFRGYMIEISQRCLRVADYLKNEVGFQNLVVTFQVTGTTTNMVESLNSMLVTTREFPFIALLDVI